MNYARQNESFGLARQNESFGLARLPISFGHEFLNSKDWN